MPSISITPDQKSLALVTDSANPLLIHPLWLRERCDGTDQIDALTQQRLYTPADLDPDLHIDHIDRADNSTVDILFSDQTHARFNLNDLIDELQNAPTNFLPTPVSWQNDDQDQPSFRYTQTPCDADLAAMVAAFLIHGYVILDHVPSREGAVLEVARQFGFPRETNFGLLFDVRSVPSATDLAYTAYPLAPHTDNPYRIPVPGIQLLHCLINSTEGGLSTLVDGLAVAEHLRTHHPAEFACLTSTQILFRYVDANTDLTATAPFIALDTQGNFAALHYSPRLDATPLLPPESLATFYAARRLLNELLNSPVFERRFLLRDGELMMFDNRRLLHGRTGFDPASGHRHLQGCYIDHDGPGSLYRVLHRRLK